MEHAWKKGACYQPAVNSSKDFEMTGQRRLLGVITASGVMSKVGKSTEQADSITALTFSLIKKIVGQLNQNVASVFRGAVR